MKRLLALSVAVAAIFAGSAVLPAAENDKQGIEFFEKKIRPVLVKECYECHSADSKEVKAGLLLDTREGMRHGGESGDPAVVPGNEDESSILAALRHETYEMPPDRQLSENVIADFAKWIRMGAPDPREAAGPVVRRVIDLEEGKKFWAFQPPQAHNPPAVKDASWPRDDIDRFILARIEEAGLHPAADADRRTLIRRLYFDLIGLPPTPEEVEAFVADGSRAALEQVVDRLLGSPQFGERWGRHWMDVARFSESNGRERNYSFPHAWRYRNWVIDAFNNDKPFDRFVMEQLAGDLLPAQSQEEQDANHVATGFLAIGAKSLNDRNREQFQMDVADEQIDATSKAFLAITISCARCHDHKFDPIPTSEYYAIAGIFTSTQTLYGTARVNGNRQPSTLYAMGDNGAEALEAKKKQDQEVARLSSQIKQVEKQISAAGGKSKDDDSKADKKTKAKQAAATTADLKQQLKTLNKQLAEAKNRKLDSAKLAMAVQESGKAADETICIRGEIENRGDSVPRGFSTVVGGHDSLHIPADASGRLQLAQWIASPENPLTARVIANRVWHHLFGQGIVRTVDNFGANGETPSHPELLDHLAVRMVQEGWSVKQLIRAIVLTRTYGLSSGHDADNYEVDPDNRLVWRMNSRRLEAEVIRDSLLAVSGQLALTPPDSSVMAELPEGEIGRSLRIDTIDATAVHRSVYLPTCRGALPEIFRVFDFPEPSNVEGRREITVVPLQSLFLLNSPFVMDQAEHLAGRVLDQQGLDDAQRVEQVYRLALQRLPSADEAQRAAVYLREMLAGLQAGKAKDPQTAAWTSLAQALLVSAEFRYLE